MKKRILLPALLLLGSTLIMTSCKKKKDDDVSPTNPTNPNNPGVPTCVVERAITNIDSTQVTYDSNNRLIKDQTFNNSGGSEGYTLYTYSSSKIIEQEYDENGDLFAQTDYYLNANSNAGYSVHVEDGDTENADTTWYTYDSAKHNVRRATKNTSTIPIIGTKTASYDTTWYTYTGDNLTKIVNRNDAGDIETTIYSYGTTDAKSKFLAPGQDTGILGLYGSTSSKLPVSATMGSNTFTFDYVLNAEGYVTRYQITPAGAAPNITRFVYTCK